MPIAPLASPSDLGLLGPSILQVRSGDVVAQLTHDDPNDLLAHRQSTLADPGPATRIREACRILIVDDDAAIRMTVSEFLQDEGFDVRTASNGREAIAIIERERPTLVLLDMRMPILDGSGFAAELRARGIELPLVVMTAARDARRWAEEINATAYVAKPFDFPVLLDTFDQLCRGR